MFRQRDRRAIRALAACTFLHLPHDELRLHPSPALVLAPGSHGAGCQRFRQGHGRESKFRSPHEGSFRLPRASFLAQLVLPLCMYHLCRVRKRGAGLGQFLAHRDTMPWQKTAEIQGLFFGLISFENPASYLSSDRTTYAHSRKLVQPHDGNLYCLWLGTTRARHTQRQPHHARIRSS